MTLHLKRKSGSRLHGKGEDDLFILSQSHNGGPACTLAHSADIMNELTNPRRVMTDPKKERCENSAGQNVFQDSDLLLIVENCESGAGVTTRGLSQAGDSIRDPTKQTPRRKYRSKARGPGGPFSLRVGV